MHMLSVYPDLLTEQTPPPVPDVIFKGFTIIKVTQSFIGKTFKLILDL